MGAAGDYVKVDPGTAGSVNLVGWDDEVIDFYVPVFTLLQFIFYFGWLQVKRTKRGRMPATACKNEYFPIRTVQFN